MLVLVFDMAAFFLPLSEQMPMLHQSQQRSAIELKHHSQTSARGLRRVAG
jgi:hypothetical protein